MRFQQQSPGTPSVCVSAVPQSEAKPRYFGLMFGLRPTSKHNAAPKKPALAPAAPLPPSTIAYTTMSGHLEKKRFDAPDVDHKQLHQACSVDVIRFKDAPSMRRVIVKPGWKWSTCSPEATSGAKQSCSASHTGVMQKGAI